MAERVVSAPAAAINGPDRGRIASAHPAGEPARPAPVPQAPGPQPLDHCVLRSFEQAQELRRDWDELAGRHGDLFSTYDWGRTWWHYYGRNRRLQIHAIRDGANLVAVLPLFVETLRPCGVPLRAVRLVGCDHTLTPAGLAMHPSYAPTAIRQLIRWLSRHEAWDLLHLGPVLGYTQAAAPTAAVLAAALEGEPSAGKVTTGLHDACTTVYALPETFEGYLASLSGSERRNILRCERHGVSDQALQTHCAGTEQEVAQAMAALVRLHQGLWTGKGKLGQFRDWPDYEHFHADLAQRFLASGRLVLVTLKTRDELIGVEYGYHFGSRVHALIRGYSDQPPWRSYSIGRMLHCHMVRQAVSRGATLMDDGRGAFEYKRRLGGQLRYQQSLTVVRGGGGSKLRVWAALRAAWLIHAVYARLWFDWLRPRLPLPARSLRRSYIRMSFLAHLFKRRRADP